MRRMISKAHDTADGLKINGNLQTTGYIKSGYQLDEDLKAEVSDGTPISYIFQHARISDGKLTIVFSFELKKPSIAYESKAVGMRYNSVIIPEEVGKMLYPMTEFTGDRTVGSMTTIAQGYDANGDQIAISPSVVASVNIAKALNTNSQLTWSIHLTTPASSTNTYFWRFEFNFIV